MVGKLVVFKIGEGNFEQGFPVILQISQEGQPTSVEIMGKFPPYPEIPQLYHQWQSTYRQLGGMRIKIPPGQVTRVSYFENCEIATTTLQAHLKQWLSHPSIRDLREHILDEVRRDEPVRVILQTQDIQLRRLPWHLWDLLERRPQVEIALSAEYRTPSKPLQFPVKILAILGNNDSIDIQPDKILLEQLPGTQIKLLEKPKRSELNEQLWKQNWDILFFAGHSFSCAQGKQGQILINDTESLTLSQLKFALKTAVENGLKLAIFNSCDGLGLAQELADLKIPQVIVMREPVPDPIAKAFLKYFLETFSKGESFYTAVRKAREQLQGLEGDFPCATWLPVICQNPSEPPLIWPQKRLARFPKLLKIGIAIASGILLTLSGLKAVEIVKDQNKNTRFSLCEKLLITDQKNQDQEAGVQACARGDFTAAIRHFELSLQVKPNDPETLIYLNNAKAAIHQKRLKIATSVPIGGNLNIAQEILRGVAQAQQEINQTGGIRGHLLQVEIVNDDNNPKISAQEIAPKLVKDQTILAVIGHNASEVSVAAAPVYQQGGLVMITPTSSALEIANLGSYIFRTVSSNRVDAINLSHYAVKIAHHQKTAICTDSNSPYSESLKTEFTNAVLEDGGQISSISCDFSDINFHLSGLMGSLIADGVDSLLLAPSVERINQAIEFAKVSKGRFALFSGSTMYTYDTLRLGQIDVNNMVLAVVWHPSLTSENPFFKNAVQLWGGAVNWRTAMAYDATQAIREGLRQNPTRKGLQKALSSPNFEAEGGTVKIQFLPSGDRKRTSGIGILVKIQPQPNTAVGYDFVPLESVNQSLTNF